MNEAERRKLVVEERAKGIDPFKRLVRESDARVVANGGTSIFSPKSSTVLVPERYERARHGMKHDREKYHP